MSSGFSWRRPPCSLALPPNEVHVWRANLGVNATDLERLRATLTADERARAERFHSPKDQQHYVAARGTLRVILARYLDRSPDQFEFSYGKFGKPELALGSEGGGLRFNLSHSQGLAVYAVTRYQDIGVDLEGMRANLAWDEIAGRFFAPREVEALRLIPPPLRAVAFLNCWTRKEAFMKARGQGLSLPPDQFEVSVGPGEPARLLRTTGGPQETSQWSLQDLEPAPGFVAAVAVRVVGCEFRLWE